MFFFSLVVFASVAAWVTAAGLGVLLVFAGCSGSSPRSSDDPGSLPDLLTEDTGAIVGLVIDDALSPLPAATLILDGTQQTTSALDGSFSFPRIEPGTHAIVATTPGFVDAAQEVGVIAGEIAKVRLTLTSAAAAAAFYETKILTGLIGCGSAVLVAGIQPTPVCAPTQTVGPSLDSVNRHLTDFVLGERQPDWVGFWVETVWVSTQALGGNMNVDWYTVSAPAGTAGRVSDQIDEADLEGPSPLRASFRVNATQGNATSQVSGQTAFCQKTCILSGYHFASATRVTPDFGVGLMVQQRFDDYLTLFHYGDLPAEFSALPDG